MDEPERQLHTLLAYRARQTNLIYHWNFIGITSERLLKVIFVLTMLNITIYKHVLPDGCAADIVSDERELESLSCMLLFKTPVCIPFKTFTDDIKMLVVSTKRIRIRLALNILCLSVIANEHYTESRRKLMCCIELLLIKMQVHV